MALTSVVAYDISHDQRRAKVAAILQGIGDRVQQSVFVCVVSSELLEESVVRIRTLLDLEEDSVYVFKQCDQCWESLTAIGQAHPRPAEYFWAAM